MSALVSSNIFIFIRPYCLRISLVCFDVIRNVKIKHAVLKHVFDQLLLSRRFTQNLTALVNGEDEHLMPKSGPRKGAPA